ncbi:unnamed protein product [Closterium sp. NIES-65]|nr:unnamed protein product [Closterium sp. NIES-65]
MALAAEAESSPRVGSAEGGRGLLRACGLIGGGAVSAQQGNPAPQGPRRGGRRRRRADAAREAEESVMEGESGEVEEEGPENRRPLSVVIHGPGASFFVGTELIAAGGRARADGARGSGGAQGDRVAPGGSRRGAESAQVDGADSGEDIHSNEYGDSEYDSSEMEQEEEGARRRRGRRRIEVLMDRCRGGVDAVVRWGRSTRQHLRGTRGLARGGAGTSAARGGGTSDSGDADTESDYDERDSEDRERGWAPYDECDENEGYCMECRRSADGEQGAEAGKRQQGCAHGSVGGNGDGAEQEDGGESDSSAVSCSSGYSRSSGGESKASADNDGDGAEAALLDFQFAPLREASGQAEGDMWVEAVHVVLPPPPASARGGWEGVDVAGMEAIFDPRCVKWFQRVKRLFIALLLLGSIFYIVSFIAGVMSNRGKSVEVLPVDTGATGQGQAAAAGGTGGLDTNFDYVSHAMLTSSNIWVAMAYLSATLRPLSLVSPPPAYLIYYLMHQFALLAPVAARSYQNNSSPSSLPFAFPLHSPHFPRSSPRLPSPHRVLYLSLDMIGFAGAILENVSLLTLYIVVELIITFISALEALRPFLLFRLLVILLALRLRYCALKVEDAERRLFSRLMGRPMPPPNRRTWLARLGIFPGTLSAMFRHAPLSRFQLRGRPWYAELQKQGVGEAARVDAVGVEVCGQEQEQVAQQQQQQQLQQEEDVKEGALEAIGGSTSDPGSADSSCTPCPHAAAVAACNAPVPLLPTAGPRTGTAGVVAVEADETPLGSPGASEHFSIDITDTPLTPHTQVEPEQAAEAAEEERESDAALAAQLLLPPPFPLVPHLPVPRTPSSSLPPSRSVSLTHQQQSTDADLPASPSAAMLPPATSFTLMSSPLPSLPSTSA